MLGYFIWCFWRHVIYAKKIKKNGGGGTLNDTMGGRDLHGGKRFLEGGSSNFGGHHGHAESGPK